MGFLLALTQTMLAFPGWLARSLPSSCRDGNTYVLEAAALVVLQQPMLAAEVSVAEAAVPDDALCLVPAVLEAAPDLLGRHCCECREEC